MAKKKVTDERILEVITSFDVKTRKEQAAELGISTVTLWQRLKDNPEIETRAKDLIDSALLSTVISGFKAMDKIICDSRSKDKDRIQALKLVLQYRGELIDKKEHDIPGGINITISEKK